MTSQPAVAVVVAAIDARATIAASLDRVRAEVAGRGEVVVVDASRDGTAEFVESLVPGVRVERRAPGLLTPELWRDGLRAISAPLVAFTTAQMVPRPGWLSALLATLDASGAAAVGGPIAPGPGLDTIGRATFLQRFARALPPVTGAIDPPGDNSLYRRDRLVGLEALWADGFWEVPILRALRDRGATTAIAPGAVVEFVGGTGLAPLLRQRLRHARRFGASRSLGRGPAHRLARTAAAPLIPPLLVARALAALRRRRLPVAPWAAAMPALGLLATTWALGELAGTWEESTDFPI
ncbi:MAG TPA: glycosyltransferase [Isosphaeraceae bacterium]|jgi:hypothetical protein|nr:glycosyltransferase [Isosphaeraceae bacterium]